MSFAKLDSDLRLRIWKLTWRPRIVSFGDEDNKAPLPAFLLPKSAHVNREARGQTLAHYDLIETRAHKDRSIDVRFNYSLDTIRLYPGLGAFPEIENLDVTRIERLVAVSYQMCGTSHQTHKGQSYDTYRQFAALCREEPPAALDMTLLAVFPSLQQLWVTAYELKDASEGGAGAWWRGSGEHAVGGPHLIDYRYAPSTGHINMTLLSFHDIGPIMNASAHFWSEYPDTTPQVIARIELVQGKGAKTRARGGWLHRWAPIQAHTPKEGNEAVRERLMWRLVATEVAAFLGNGPEF
ncbi:hypothetical protein ACHAQA_002185 [Verticillium albo-atrum]